jgi:TatA/E family protein of Tat protein translocase
MSIGPMEIIIVLALALLVFGPKRLPQMGRTLGRAAREFRKASDEVKGVFDIGLNDDEPADTAKPAIQPPVAPMYEPSPVISSIEAGPRAYASGSGADPVPGLAGFLGVAAAEPAAEAAISNGGSAAPALATFLGADADARPEGAADTAPEVQTDDPAPEITGDAAPQAPGKPDEPASPTQAAAGAG